jgi:hypothetical protein
VNDEEIFGTVSKVNWDIYHKSLNVYKIKVAVGVTLRYLYLAAKKDLGIAKKKGLM